MDVAIEEFLLELQALDETQERVEAVSDEMLKAQRDGDDRRAKEMVDLWMKELRASDFQSERIAFLYVANHVLQKTLFGDTPVEKPLFQGFFQTYLKEAVSLVSNSPMDRQSVTRLLELWHEKEVFPEHEILKMWKCTGEDIPGFLQNAAAASGEHQDHQSAETTPETLEDPDAELHHAPLPELPLKLNARSANPVLDVLKEIDRHKAAIRYLDENIKKSHQYIIHHAPSRYPTAEALMDDRQTTSFQMKQRVEDCLKLLKVRNKLLGEIPQLKNALQQAIAKMIEYETSSGSKIEQKLEQCDLIDIGLADLAEHRDAYPEEWSLEARACTERRKRREEEQRQREEEMARLQQEAIAESAAHAMHLEQHMHGNKDDLQSLSKELGVAKQQDQESKPDQDNELVWHPVLKELVPLKSLNLEWEEWRDH